jgi:26S proteasome non-ATPase regulatory subunit 9
MAARMENLHAPTVASGPTSGPTTNGAQTNGLSFAQLQSKKDALEAEIRALSNVLDSVRSIHMGRGLS